MPGCGIIGLRYSGNRNSHIKNQHATAQSVEVRNLARLLRVLEDPEKAVTALVDALKQQQQPLGKKSSKSSTRTNAILSHLESSLNGLRQQGWHTFKLHGSIEMAQALEEAFQLVTSTKKSPPPTSDEDSGDGPKDNNNDKQHKKQPSGYDLFSKSLLRKLVGAKTAYKAGDVELAWAKLSAAEKQLYQAKAAAQQSSRRHQPKGLGDLFNDSPTMTSALHHQTSVDDVSTTKKDATKLALVSDSEGDGSSTITETQKQDDAAVNVDEEVALMDFWPTLLEAVNLQVSSQTTRTWGKKKIYEVFRLAGPTTPVSNLDQLRAKIAKEFMALYQHRDARLVQYNDCRVFCAHRSQPVPGTLWIQINIGHCFDLHNVTNISVSGEKKKKAGTEYMAMIVPESCLVALTASRAPSRARFTPQVLSVLETVLTCSVAGGYAASCGAEQSTVHRIHDLSGTEPLDLIRTAKAIEAQDAVGRYASYSAAGAVSDPISELQAAATGSLLNRNKQQERLEIGAKHGREIAKLASTVSNQADANGEDAGARLVAVSKTDGAMCVDHSVQEQNKRKRSRELEFGTNDGDCPRRQSVRWDWKGMTSAAAASWLSSAPSASNSEDAGQKNHLPKCMFKCRVVMKGSDVFAGMKALMSAGVLKGPLPAYVRDAPMLGGKITVDRGAIVENKDAANNSNEASSS